MIDPMTKAGRAEVRVRILKALGDGSARTSQEVADQLYQPGNLPFTTFYDIVAHQMRSLAKDGAITVRPSKRRSRYYSPNFYTIASPADAEPKAVAHV